MNATEEMYEKYEKCITKLVHHYVRKSRFHFDELLSEANMGFLHAVDTFDKNKASFHTHCYITINGRLRNYCNKPKQIEVQNKPPTLKDGRAITLGGVLYSNIYVERDHIDTKKPNPEQKAVFNDLVESMSKEAREVVETILETPKEMLELVKQMSASRQGHMHVYRSNVTRYFKDLGWKRKKILKAYSEIRSTFNMG